MDDTISLHQGPLSLRLVQDLPIYVDGINSDKQKLNVGKIASAIKFTNEGVYKWLRTSSISRVGVKKLMALIESEENRALLAALGRPMPTYNDYVTFLFRG